MKPQQENIQRLDRICPLKEAAAITSILDDGMGRSYLFGCPQADTILRKGLEWLLTDVKKSEGLMHSASNLWNTLWIAIVRYTRWQHVSCAGSLYIYTSIQCILFPLQSCPTQWILTSNLLIFSPILLFDQWQRAKVFPLVGVVFLPIFCSLHLEDPSSH